MSKPPDMSITETAQELGIHPESLRRLARTGRLPFMYKVGGQWRGDPIKLAAYKEAGGAKSPGRPTTEERHTIPVRFDPDAVDIKPEPRIMTYIAAPEVEFEPTYINIISHVSDEEETDDADN